MTVTRRQMTLGAAASGLRAPTTGSAESLKALAEMRGITFGTEVTARDVFQDSAYARLVASQCAIITPGIEAKWASVEPLEGKFTFEPLDALAEFADREGLALHMHNIVWAVGMPGWLTRALEGNRGADVLRRHIDAVMGRYKGRVRAWDVVNEPVDPRWPSAAEGLCTTPWRRDLGPGFVALAITMAAAADPFARLLINDDDLEYEGADRDKKRATYLRLIEKWIRQGVKLSGFGLEAHLKPDQRFAERDYRRFLRDLAGFGLELFVTELDVCDRDLPGDVAARDQITGTVCRRFLDVALDETALRTVITWGLADRYTYMNHDPTTRRPDMLPSRPLAYDAALDAKPMREAIANAFRGAPDRRR